MSDNDRGTACRNLCWSKSLLTGLVAAGLRVVVLSPGSRSTPLVLAAQSLAQITPVPILDERSAAFFALGLARASGRSVGLLCTSGSAPAHWYPALIEASHWGVPLVLISADRPPELRGWGANQTIDQTRLFGTFVREFHDPGLPDDAPARLNAVRALGYRAGCVSLGPTPGPVHINQSFREPLVPAGDCRCDEVATYHAEALPAHGKRASAPSFCPPQAWPSGRGIIVCGPGDYPADFGPALFACAAALDLPVLVDPLSGLRFTPASRHRIARYDGLLRNEPAARALRPDWVLGFGAAPVSKTLGEWFKGVAALRVSSSGAWNDPNQDALALVHADPAQFCRWLADADAIAPNPDWLARWVVCEEAVARYAADYLDRADWCEGQLITDLIAALPAGAALFVSNSLPIRQIDTWSGVRDEPLSVYCNRGVSGIDGQLSTLAGLNAAGVPTVGLLGDLAFLHDLSGLLLAEHWRAPVVVLNNGGGRIFDYLPQAGLPGFESLWRTPRPIDLAALAAPFGITHRRVSDRSDFQAALAMGGGMLVEVVIDAEKSLGAHRDYWRGLGRLRF